MSFDINAFIEKQKESLSPEEQKALRDGFTATADYHRKMNDGKAEIERRRAEEDEYHRQIAAWEAEQKTKLELAAAVEQRLGVPLAQLVQSSAPGFMQSPVTGEYVSKAEVAALTKSIRESVLAEVAPAVSGTFHLAVHMPKYAWEYQQKYGKMLDGPAFVEFCRTNNISDSDIGFKLYTAEDEKKLLSETHAKEVAAAREEGERAALSRHHIMEPTARPVMRSPLMRQPTMPTPPVQQPAPVAPVVPPAPPNPGVPAAVATAAPDLAARMQANFLAAKDK